MEQWPYQLERSKEKELMKWQKCPTQRSSGKCQNGVLRRSELCQYKNLLMKRKRVSIEIICEDSNNTLDWLNRCDWVHVKNKNKFKIHLTINMLFAWKLLFCEEHCRVPFIYLISKVSSQTLKIWAVRTAIQNSQILVFEVMKDK